MCAMAHGKTWQNGLLDLLYKVIKVHWLNFEPNLKLCFCLSVQYLSIQFLNLTLPSSFCLIRRIFFFPNVNCHFESFNLSKSNSFHTYKYGLTLLKFQTCKMQRTDSVCSLKAKYTITNLRVNIGWIYDQIILFYLTLWIFIFVPGRFGIICMEDLIHEIYTAGKQFKHASNFLWPFKLSTPRGGWVRKYNHYNDGGDFGNREEKINALLRKMV